MGGSRLDAIIDLVPKCDVAADIGTDHAYVPISLIKKNIVLRCIASDLREGPLKIARGNISKNNLSDVIETRLGEGLSVIAEGEVHCIIISGMGGTLIKNILEEGRDVISCNTTLILQPNKYPSDVRYWLYKNNYDIYKEKLVLEDKRMYNIICARLCEAKKEVDPFFYYVGDKLADDPLYGVYIKDMYKKYKKALCEMNNMRDKHSDKKEQYEWVVSCLEREIKNSL